MPHRQSVTLPPEFLTNPSPTLSAQRIDFSKTSIPAYDGLYAVVLDNVLSPEECEQLLKCAEASTDNGWEPAKVNVGGGRQALITEARDCDRIIWDSEDVVGRVWRRIAHIPEVREIMLLEDVPKIFGNGPSSRGEVWKFTRPNERMRFLKYREGQYFRPHCDGSYETPDGNERSYFTLHLYLNNVDGLSSEDLADLSPGNRQKLSNMAGAGGATTFHCMSFNEDRDYHVLPKSGRILLFQHRTLMHSGAEVLSGVKYTMRTDLMYAVASSKSETRSKMPKLQD